jgi:hypothetical protein
MAQGGTLKSATGCSASSMKTAIRQKMRVQMVAVIPRSRHVRQRVITCSVRDRAVKTDRQCQACEITVPTLAS